MGTNQARYQLAGPEAPVEQVPRYAQCDAERMGGAVAVRGRWEYAARAGTTATRAGHARRVLLLRSGPRGRGPEEPRPGGSRIVAVRRR